MRPLLVTILPVQILRGEFVHRKAVELHCGSVLVGFAEDEEGDAMCFCERGNGASSGATRDGTVRVQRVGTDKDFVNLRNNGTEGGKKAVCAGNASRREDLEKLFA